MADIPQLSFISRNENQNTLAFCSSIDSGAGITNVMGKLVENSVGQRERNIMLPADAHNISESFNDLSQCFG